MRATTLLTLALTALGVSAAPAAEAVAAGTPLEARACTPGSYFPNPKPSGSGCIWYYCQGGNIVPWIDCGLNWCVETSGVPTCTGY